MRTSFINFALLVKLMWWTAFLFVGYAGVVAFIAGDHLAAVMYLTLIGVLSVSDALHRIWKIAREMETFRDNIQNVLPIFGQSLDMIASQVVDINKVVLCEFLSEEQKAEMIELTYQMHGDETAEKMREYLFTTPVDLMRKKKDTIEALKLELGEDMSSAFNQATQQVESEEKDPN